MDTGKILWQRDKMLEVTCNGLAPRPGESQPHPIHFKAMNLQGKAPLEWAIMPVSKAQIYRKK